MLHHFTHNISHTTRCIFPSHATHISQPHTHHLGTETERHVLRAVLKHVPFWNIFQIGMVCLSEKYAFLKNVSDWHRANFVISRVDSKMSIKTRCIWSSLAFITEKQTNAAWPYLWSRLFSQIFVLQDLAFYMRLRYDEVCTVQCCQSEACFRNAHFSERHTMPIWNMFHDGTCFRTARNTRTLSLQRFSRKCHA